MSIKCNIGDVVRVYRHMNKIRIGLVGTVGYIGKETISVNILGKGSFLVNKSYLAHVKKETVVIVGFHKTDAYSDDPKQKVLIRIGREVIILLKCDGRVEGYFCGDVYVPSLDKKDRYYAVKLHTYNKGKK